MGAFFWYTLQGEPERIMPARLSRAISRKGVLNGRITENTFSSLTRLAISCVYCEPKSRTKMVSVSELTLFHHADLLGGLEQFAFGLDRWRDNNLGHLKLFDVLGAHITHAGPQCADQILRPVIEPCGSE